MSNKTLDNVIKILENISLSTTDRASMREDIASHIEANEPVRSPWASILSPLQSLGRSAMVAAVVLMAVGGVSMAAEQALPGDPLYAFKLNVNESFMSLTSLSPTADAVYESRLANRRIAELEALAARGDLNETVSVNLTTAISNHTASARAEIAKISARGGGGDAASLETELLSSLQTHSDILADLADQNGKKVSATAQAASRLRAVAQNKTTATAAITLASSSEQVYRTGLENRHKQLSSVQTKRLLERTAERLDVARAQFTHEFEDIQSEKIKTSVQALLNSSAETLDEAINFIHEDEYGEADPLLREALTYAHRATVIMNARQALESSSGIAIDKLLDSPAFSPSVSSSTDVQVGGADVIPDETDEDAAGGLMTPDESHSATSTEEVSTSSSSTSAVQGTSTEATTTENASSSDDGQNLTREQRINIETHRRISDVLERVKETLNSHTPQGFLPARQSHEDGN